MTSQVYYRKWRPSSFTDLVGQEHVATTLREAIKQDRVSHSYLFCGPRGTGKTTTARVLAKAVNCLEPRDGDPCNACRMCSSVNEGRFMDIIELDAASNRGIDEIRDIRDKVNFSPVEGRRKVYIIDEAHMLTDQASNAFLKTLEEPPGHVIFVLCTTEAHKILATIVSRCQRFDFRRLPAEIIYRRLAEIIAGEGAAVDSEALRLVARHASGSLRDAENLLEQLVVSYGDGVSVRQVEELLGLGQGERWLELVKYLLMGNTSASLAAINQAAWDGADLRQAHRQTLELLRGAMLLEWGAEESLDLPDHITGQLRELVGQLPGWRVVKAVKHWADVNMRYDAPSTLPLELAAVEICNDDAVPPPVAEPAYSGAPPAANPAPPPRRASADAPAAAAPGNSAGERRAPPERPRPPAAAPSRAPAPSGQPAAGVGDSAATAPLNGEAGGNVEAGGFHANWLNTVKALGRCKGKKYNLGALLRDCKTEAVALDGDTLVLPFAHRTNMERMQEEMDDPNGRQMVTEAVGRFFGEPYKLKLMLVGENGAGAGATRPPQQSPLVRAAQGIGARIIREVEL